MEEGEIVADLSKDNIATTDMDLDTSIEIQPIIEEHPTSPGQNLPDSCSEKIMPLLDLPLDGNTTNIVPLLDLPVSDSASGMLQMAPDVYVRNLDSVEPNSSTEHNIGKHVYAKKSRTHSIKDSVPRTANRCLVQVELTSAQTNSDTPTVSSDKNTTSALHETQSPVSEAKSDIITSTPIACSVETVDTTRVYPPCMSRNLQYPEFELKDLKGEAYSSIYGLIEKFAEQLSEQNKVKAFTLH